MNYSGSKKWEAWFRCYQPKSEPQLRLVCFPHAGGAASFFHAWPRRLPPTVELVAVQYPGRQDRVLEACIDDIDRLSDLIANALVPSLDRPVALFGHSMGAAVAYEVARRLAQLPRSSLTGLFVSGRPAPQHDRGGSIHSADDDALLGDLCRLGATSEDVLNNSELRALLLPALRSDYRLSETYRHRPGPKLNSPIMAYLGDRDPEVNVNEARGWGELTNGNFYLRSFAGDHFYLVPRQTELISEMLQYLGLPMSAAPAWPSTP